MRRSSPRSQNISPRSRVRLGVVSPAKGSKLHFSAPLAASSAKTRSFGDAAYITPCATTGWHCISEPLNASPVS